MSNSRLPTSTTDFRNTATVDLAACTSPQQSGHTVHAYPIRPATRSATLTAFSCSVRLEASMGAKQG